MGSRLGFDDEFFTQSIGVGVGVTASRVRGEVWRGAREVDQSAEGQQWSSKSGAPRLVTAAVSQSEFLRGCQAAKKRRGDEVCLIRLIFNKTM